MSANPSGFSDTFGNMGDATNFGNTNALGATNSATNPLGPIEPMSGGGTASQTVSPLSTSSGVAAPASTGLNVGIGGSGANGAPAAAGASSGFDWGSLLGTLGGDVSSFLNSPLGSLAEFTALYKQIAGQASNTQKENNALAGQISAIGQPDVTAGKNMLDAYTGGKLTAPFQGQVDAAKYADQATATSQTQQVASALANAGGQNMQSAQISQGGQIAAQKDQADRLAVSNAFLGELSASLNLTQTGGAFVQSGIMQEIQSNTQLQAQLADLMGSLAKAYAEQTANSGKGGSGGGSGNSIGSLVTDATKLWDGIKGLFGSGTSTGPMMSPGAGVTAPVAGEPGYGSLANPITNAPQATPGSGVTAQQPGEPGYASQASDALGLGSGVAAGAAGAGGAAAGGAGAGSITVADLGAASSAPAIGTLGGAGAAAGEVGAGAAGAGAAGGAGTGAAGGAEAGTGSGAGVGAAAGIAAVAVAEAYAVYQDWASNNGGLGRSGQVITLSNADGTGPGNIPIHPWDYQSKDPATLKRYVNMAKIINQQKAMNANAAKRGPQAANLV